MNKVIDEFHNYSDKRNIDKALHEKLYAEYKMPRYLVKVLPENKNIKILDIGCGSGLNLKVLKEAGFNNLLGIDIDDDTISFCKAKNLPVEKIDFINFIEKNRDKFDLIIMSHVLEHFEKNKIIETLKIIKEKLLSEKGEILIMVPNAQSNTGAYWAYEDFTHHTLFTAGSLYYVLRAAGFTKIEFLDPDGLDSSVGFKRLIRYLLLKLYKRNIWFWNKVTNSGFHITSPQIFTYELKVIAK